MDYNKDITEFHQNAIGVTFDFKTTQERDVHENVPSHPDYGACIVTRFTRTNFYATGFSFDYKGARISGRLPEVSELTRLGIWFDKFALQAAFLNKP